MARERGREAEVGMLLDLVGSAIGDPRLQGEAEAFSSNRPSQAQSTRYLPEPRGIYERELAEEHTPDVVRRWGFRMNQTLESVRSFLEKHVGRSGVPQI